MRLYLSSFRLGHHPERMLDLLAPSGPVAVIANATDDHPAETRRADVARERGLLAGWTPTEHPEDAALEWVAEQYRRQGIRYRRLQDGQAIVVNGRVTELL